MHQFQLTNRLPLHMHANQAWTLPRYNKTTALANAVRQLLGRAEPACHRRRAQTVVGPVASAAPEG